MTDSFPETRKSYSPEFKRNIRIAIGKRIRELRMAKGLTQREFASDFEARESYLRGVESGSKECSLWRYIEIADSLEVKVSDLFKYVA